ncbi:MULTISPECIES: NUDIX hydrolase [unclassified Granulicatella]|uniref:NUDIX hydrolase n=1 Tax=unclassified Granulicatella TaxID=2630493 RepID=UPI0010746AE1|nr:MULTISPECIES: NUDIX domain-containing protein [unclassified Granulicatella]MBF0779621.1 NUDIX domain-containing protein [Granulicatella sp. 19428wC4_WM01]TFU96420.1 NUDIX domain-containing protein [Granulicatella sp. WM01]
MDFRFFNNNVRCGVRAAELIMRDDYIYLVYANQKYATLGGAALVNETTQEAVVREVFEELHARVEVNQLAFVVENFFTEENIQYHNLEYYYFVTLLDEPAKYVLDEDAHFPCEWVHVSELKNLDLRPRFLKEKLVDWKGIEHIIVNDR